MIEKVEDNLQLELEPLLISQTEEESDQLVVFTLIKS